MARFVPLLLVAACLGCAWVRCSPPLEAAAGPAVSPVPREVARTVRLARVARGLSKPVFLGAAPGDAGGRLFVVEKTGTVRLLRPSGEGLKADATPFLDLSGRVSRASEQGLLGLAFHPSYATNRRLFVHYTDRKGDTRVVEYRTAEDDPDRADPKSAREILAVDQPYSNHNGGHLVFGPDGALWVGLGDGGAGGDPHDYAQNPDSRLGKMLRIEVDGEKPKVEIWQKGHRNPWRYAFDAKTGDLYVADVGQNRYEEVHVLPPGKQKGANLGWNVMEGMHCFEPAKDCDRTGLEIPQVEYDHGDGCSITGGIVYRGKAIPALEGRYFYADYCTALLRSFRFAGEGKPVADHWEWRPALDPDEKLASLSSFGEDAAGEMYLLSLDGTIWKFLPAEGISPPAAPATPRPSP